jgi:O-antigen ligase
VRVPIRAALPKLVWALLAVVVIVGVIAADPAERWHTFKAAPPAQEAPGAAQVGSHLSSGGGSGRWQFWSAAADQWREHPLAGDGAGSFEPWWAQHGTLDWFVRNAHSLWLETLGELGVIGLLLLAGAFAVGIAAGFGRLRGRVDEEQATIAALLAVVLGFVVGAALDWVWQLPVIAALALLSLGLLTGPATSSAEPRERLRSVSFGTRAGLVLAAWIAICAQALPFLASEQVSASQRAVGRGDLTAALERARSAEAIQPWASSPRLQLALVHEEAGQLTRARQDIAAAIARDESDWRLRVVAARLAVKDGDLRGARTALARARALNPRSRLLRSTVGAGEGR